MGWSDHINAMASFAMSILIGGLLGSLFLYISFSLSAGGENTRATKAWNSVGFYFLTFNFLLLMIGCIVLMFAQDAYAESQDPFFVRDGRFGGYSKITLLAVFTPITLIILLGSVFSLVRACQQRRQEGS